MGDSKLNVPLAERQAANVASSLAKTPDLERATIMMHELMGRSAIPQSYAETQDNLRLLPEGELHKNAQEAEVMPGKIVMGPDGMNGSWNSGGTSVPVRRIGRGGSGQIFRGGGAIYKRIEGLYKDVYREALIEGFLASDPRYGNNICKIHSMYKDPDELLVFYYKLESVDQTLAEYLDTFGTVSTKILADILILIARILKHFNKKYNFRHNDLHALNIMVNRDGDYKIIDFGLSCIKIGPYTYGSQAACRSYDLLFLLADLYEDGSIKKGRDIFTDYCKKKLLACMGDSKTGFNLYSTFDDYNRDVKEKLSASFKNQGELVEMMNELTQRGFRKSVKDYMRFDSSIQRYLTNRALEDYSPWNESYDTFMSSALLQERFTNYDKFVEYWVITQPGIGGRRRKTKKKRRTHRGAQ
jgi:serine/threonine protein kinase